MNKKTIKYSFLATLPVMAGYLVLGMGFGILLHDKGYSFWWAILMSLCIYAGSMQYVGVDSKKYYILVSVMDQCYWVIGSFVGGFLGSALQFNTTGIDFAMTALFVVIFVEQWESTKQHFGSRCGGTS